MEYSVQAVLCQTCKHIHVVLTAVSNVFNINIRYGMVLARYKAIPNVKSTGVFGLKPLVAFTSDEVRFNAEIMSYHKISL